MRCVARFPRNHDNIRSRIQHYDLEAEEPKNLEQQLAAKAQQPVLRHDGEAAPVPVKNVVQNALQALLPIVQAACPGPSRPRCGRILPHGNAAPGGRLASVAARVGH